MLEGYSVMDWITLGSVLTSVVGILGVLVQVYRDNKTITRELEDIQEKNNVLLNELEKVQTQLSTISLNEVRLADSLKSKSEHLSDKSISIKQDTTYLTDEMKLEKMARENLYKNTSRAKEILDTMDMLKEVVLQNAELNKKIGILETKNVELSLKKDDDSNDKLLKAIGSFERQLAEYESYRESEEIRGILKRIERDLLEIEE